MQSDAIRIRRADESDAPALAILGARTFAQTFGHLYKPADLSTFLKEERSEASYTAYLADEQFAGWILEDDIGIIGYAIAGPCKLPVPDMPANSGELHHIYLTPESQGRGVGRRMIEPVLEWLRAEFDHVYLGVFSENEPAQKLYQRYGFRKISDYVFMVGDHPDAEWIMELKPRDA